MKPLLVAILPGLYVAGAAAQTAVVRSVGQTLYLPIYSHIWHGDGAGSAKPAKTLVSISVSIRNTDPTKSIRVTSAQYFDTDGNKLREYLPAPRTIGPMGTYELFVPRNDDTGGSAANFVISWKADKPTSPPLVQGLHANLPSGRSVAFTTTAVELPSE